MKAIYFATVKKTFIIGKPIKAIRRFAPLLVLLTASFLITNNAIASKKYNITSQSSFTGGGTYCQNATPGDLTLVLNTCSSGSGGASAGTFTIKWYSNTVNSTSMGTPTLVLTTTGVSTGTASTVTLTYTPSTATSGTLYYYAVMSSPLYTGCGVTTLTTSATQTVTVNGIPTAVTASGGGSFCNSTTITASGGTGGTIYFEGTTSNGTSTATASSSQVISSSGTYYFRAYNGSCWGTQGSVVVTISTPPTAVTVSGGGAFCGSTAITASGGSGGTIYFEGTTSNGTSTTTPSSSQVVSSSGTYYFRPYNAVCGWGTQGSVTVTINSIPAAVTVSGGGTYCSNTTITASGGAGGTIYFEGTTSNGTSTATPSASQVVSSSGTYYFRAYNGSCWGTEGSTAVTITTPPAAVTVSGGGTFCGSTTITASGGSGGTIYFEGTTSNGTSTATSSSSQVVSSSGTYYFRSYNAVCGWGTEGSVTVTINSIPAAVTVSGSGTYCSNATITASGGAGGTIYFEGTTSNGTSTATPSTSQVVSSSGTYYFRAYNGSCWGTQGSVTVTINTVLNPGTYSVGPTGNYNSIGAAITALQGTCSIAGAYIFELQSTYVSTVETFPLSIPNISWMSATNTVTFRPQTGATNLSITSGNTTGTVYVNRGSYFTFDGRPGGAGTANQLTIANTSTGGYAIQLINDAQNDAIKYCTVKGVNTSTSEGVIMFSTTTGTNGNDNNLIDNCDIGAGASTPTNAIYSSGTITTTATFNSNNTISNCTIHDFFSASSDHNGIWLSDGTTDWTISGNSFYETASRTMSTNYVHWCAIRIQNYTPAGNLRSTNISSCNNTQITGNYIGGTAANGGSTALTFTTTSKGTLCGIVVYGGSGTPNSIQGNTITNINFTTTAVSVNSLIFHADGNLDIGTVTPNVIGSTSGTGSIIFTYNITGGTTAKTFSPIFLGGAIITIAGVPKPEAIVPGNVNFVNNTIGALTINASDSCALRIIDFEESLCTFTINGNNLGNSTAGNIINNTKQGIAGITAFAGTPGVTQTISNNVLQNFLENNTSINNQVVGIQTIGDINQTTTGLYNISGNTLHDFNSNSRMTPTNGTVILGIDARATTPGQIVSGNTLYNFTSIDATVISRVRGILYTGGPTSGTNKISKNIIRNLTSSSTTGGIIRGIDIQAGPFSIENNMIVIGYNASGASLTNNLEIEGIYNGIGANAFYYNSVNIIGTGVASGTSNSYAYYGNNTSSKIIEDNIFINSRSNTSGSAKNYGITLANTTGMTSDYNDIYTSGTGGIFGNNGSDQVTLAAWQSATSQDSHSINTAPTFANAATDLHLTASPSTANFLISNQGIPVAGITTDIDGDTRNSYTPDPGWDEFKGTGSWIGVTSTDWATSSNWDDSIVPTSLINAKILNAPNMPSVTINPESVNDLYITTPGTLTVNRGNLQIAGNIYNNGIFNASAGSVEMNGSAAQTIPANTFVGNALYDLVISNTNAGGVSLGGALDVYHSVTYTGTGGVLNTNDNLTFKSTVSNTAWLGDMTGNTITGKATVERYLPSRKGWRFLSIPTNTTQTINQTWQEGAASTGSNPVPGYGAQLSGAGGTAAGFDLYSATPSMKTYNSATNVWTGVSGTGINIKATTGYMVFIRGDRTANAFNSPVTQTTLRTKGTVYTGDQTAITVNALQFTAIGNPYPSTIDMRGIIKTGVKDFFYVWDAALAGAYGYGAYQTFSSDGSGNYVITPGGGSYGISGSMSNYIQSGQAFFVQGDTGGGSVTFKEGAKTTGSGMVSIAPVIPTPELRANLYGVNADNSTYMADGLLINYNDNYSNNVDDLDAIKQTNTSENLGVKTSGKLLVVERRHTITDKDTVFLNLTGVSVRKYRFEFLADQLYHPGLTAFLVDNYLHTSTPLYVDGTTDADFSVTGTAASSAANRFMIVFSQLGTLPVTFTSVKAYSQDKNINVQWAVDNEMNMKEYETEKSTDGSQFSNLAITTATANGGHSANYLVTDTHPVQGYNYYRIKSVDINGKTAYSNIVKVMMGSDRPQISVYPNPVVNGIINLQLNNQPQGNYGMRLLNKSGQTIMQKQIQHTGGSSTETISLDKYLPRGMYQLEVTKPDGTKSNINVVY